MKPVNQEVIDALTIVLCDDLNTSKAITLLNAIAAKIIHRNSLNEETQAKAQAVASETSAELGGVMSEQLMLSNLLGKRTASELKWCLKEGGNMLGLLQQSPEVWFKWQPAGQSGPADADIQTQIDSRTAAKKAKNFAEADRIRDALAAQGVILEDGPAGTTWRRG